MRYLLRYKWSSLHGFVNVKKRDDFIEYGFVLEAYGGDTSSGRGKYKDQLLEDLAKDLGLKEKVIGQSIFGGESFVAWAKETFLDSPRDREQLAVGKLHSYIEQDKIVELISRETGRTVEELLQ